MPENTYLYRQVHPSWVQAGRITSQVFRPTPKDQNKLSAYDGDRISAEKAWIHYTRELSLSSCGVVAVTIQECEAESLTVHRDGKPFAEHVSIDFTSRGAKSIDGIAKRLRNAAVRRGWQYEPGPDS